MAEMNERVKWRRKEREKEVEPIIRRKATVILFVVRVW
jgi:hypothetical protein